MGPWQRQKIYHSCPGGSNRSVSGAGSTAAPGASPREVPTTDGDDAARRFACGVVAVSERRGNAPECYLPACARKSSAPPTSSTWPVGTSAVTIFAISCANSLTV
ncbi:hypothetical protein KVA01_16880 [Kocuria varians]|uniref:Uncharacterized protein n=1 Tax=Kocuria varians TaxID=1272 RepID=A0A4Y4D7F0_KOCVA|nr:hypothetical protein KVA01_16880 [Kocuria varians]